MPMTTTSLSAHNLVRAVSLVSLLTALFAVSAWALMAIGRFSGSATVAILVVSAFAASWIVTGRHGDDDISALLR